MRWILFLLLAVSVNICFAKDTVVSPVAGDQTKMTITSTSTQQITLKELIDKRQQAINELDAVNATITSEQVKRQRLQDNIAYYDDLISEAQRAGIKEKID
jgi:hypothetical protein